MSKLPKALSKSQVQTCCSSPLAAILYVDSFHNIHPFVFSVATGETEFNIIYSVISPFDSSSHLQQVLSVPNINRHFYLYTAPLNQDEHFLALILKSDYHFLIKHSL